MATKRRLRIEPYDPDAFDADGDGIVQEGTAWERPGGTRLVDEIGQAISKGRRSPTRPKGMKVVDRNNKPVDYTPTYGTAGADDPATAPAGPSPLGDHGAGSLAERGLPTLRTIAKPAPPPQPAVPAPRPPDRDPVTTELADIPGVSTAAADRPDLPEPKPPKKPIEPNKPPLGGRAQELADEAGGDYGRFLELLDTEGFVVFDYETTGIYDGNVPVQFAAIRYKDGKEVDRLNLFMNPNRPLSAWSKENLKDADGNPLTDEWLAQQDDVATTHVQQVADFMNGSIVMAHNYGYDGKIIEQVLNKGYFPSGTIDTLELLRQAAPRGDGETGPERHTLTALTTFFGVPHDQAHSADADAEATGEMFRRAMRWAAANDADASVFDRELQQRRFDEETRRWRTENAAYEKALVQFRLDKANHDRAVATADELQRPQKTDPPSTTNLPYVPGTGYDKAVAAMGAARRDWLAEEASIFTADLTAEDHQQLFDALGVADLDELHAAIAEQVTEAMKSYLDDVRGGEIHIALPDAALDAILGDGRFKSQFEAGKSKGLFSPERRREVERKNMGIPADLPDELRPIYGFQPLPEDPMAVTMGHAASTYGPLVVRLKPTVRDRATMTVGDSLDHGIHPVPLAGDVSGDQVLAGTAADYTVFHNAQQAVYRDLVEGILGKDYEWAEPDMVETDFFYSEVQIHGGVSASDIAEVIYPPGDPLDPELVARLDALGISYGEDW